MNNLRKIALLLIACMGVGILMPSCKSGADSGGVASNGNVDLKLNFKPGDKYLYSNKIDQKITSFGTTIDQSVLMEMVYAYTGDEGGNKKLSITYDHIVMNMSSVMGGKIAYDSKGQQPRENGMDMMDSLIGKSFSIYVAPDGNIVKVEGMQAMVNAAGKTGGKGAMDMSSQFSDTVVKLMMQNSFDIYPGKPVKVGDTWNKKTQMGISGMKINVDNTYTLKAVEGGKASIGMVSNLELPKTGMGPAGMQMEMKGKQEGTMEVDIATGQVISGKTTQDIKATMSSEELGQPIPMDIKGDISLSSKKM